jgi:hypothetical protein
LFSVRRDKPADWLLVIRLTFKRLAIDKEPESCGRIRNGTSEALTGLDIGQVLSPESMLNPSADGVEIRGRQQLAARNGKSCECSAGSETLSMCPINLRENREIPWSAAGAKPAVRIVKSEDARR